MVMGLSEKMTEQSCVTLWGKFLMKSHHNTLKKTHKGHYMLLQKSSQAVSILAASREFRQHFETLWPFNQQEGNVLLFW